MAANAVVDPVPGQPSPTGLLASAIVIQETDTRWEQGLTFQSEPCGTEGTAFDPCDATPDKTADAAGDVVEYVPFGIQQGVTCSTLSLGVDVERAARLALDRSRQSLIEHEFWSGVVARAESNDNQYLANSTLVTELNGSAATAPIRALAQLEVEIALCHPGRNMIHARRDTVTYWQAAGLLYKDGNLLTTAMGTIVVPGEGYNGSAPTTPDTVPSAAGAWAYATGLVVVRLGTVAMLRPESPEVTTQNLRTARAEQFVAVNLDPCCVIGVNVSHVPDTTPA